MTLHLHSPNPERRVEPIKFLVCDDDLNDVDVLKRFLNPFARSFTVVTTLDGAIEACKKESFDVMILDLSLTDSRWQDTLEAIRTLRGLNQKMRMVVCSGMPVPDLRDQALKYGADVFLPKDANMYREGGKALLLAVNVAMMHASPDESFWPRVQALREMVTHFSEQQ